MSHVSHVTCPVSLVRCHLSQFVNIFLLLELVGEGSVDNGATLSRFVVIKNALIPFQTYLSLKYDVSKLDRVTPLMADLPPTNSTTMHSWLVRPDRQFLPLFPNCPACPNYPHLLKMLQFLYIFRFQDL